MATPEENLKEILEELRKTFKAKNDSLTKGDFVDSFKNVLNYLVTVKNSLSTQLKDAIETTTSKQFDGFSKKFDKSLKEHSDEINLLKTKTGSLKDGYTPIKGKDYNDGYTPVKGVDYFDGEDGSPDTGRQIVDKVNELPTDDDDFKIGKEHIRGLDKLEKEIKRNGGTFVGGGQSVNFLVDGTLKGNPARYINLVAGPNVTLTPVMVGERIDVTISATGGTGFTEITITGTINDSNTSFTAASKPTYLVINGAMYKTTGGAITWSYLAGNITLSTPIGVSGSIYGLV